MRPLFSRGNSAASFCVSGVDFDACSGKQHPNTPVRTHPQQQCRNAAAALHVSFPKELVTEEFPSGEPLSNSEHVAYYYSSADYARFQRDRAVTAILYTRLKKSSGSGAAANASANAMASGSTGAAASCSWDESFHSIRGLEGVLSNAQSELERREHARKVLDAQDRLRREDRHGIHQQQQHLPHVDHIALALNELSCKSSYAARQTALALGKIDAQESLNAGDTTSRMLQKVRGKFYSFMMEKQPSLRSLMGGDKQPSFRFSKESSGAKGVA